jgi:pimeloyl-ACP methyl ester carboxylesterase
MKRSKIGAKLTKSAVAVTLLLAFCMGIPAQSSADPEPEACRDFTAPQKKQLVQIAPDVELQVVDWGGSGETMVLLTGLGENALAYQQFAFQFTDYFHVIGITRRGFYPSTLTNEGYDLKTRADDDIAVLDALGIKDRAIFVGHSLAGSELSAIGEKHKDRVDRLVYLDAWDLAKRWVGPDVPGPPYADADKRSLETWQAARARYQAVRLPVPSTCQGFHFQANGSLGEPMAPSSVSEKLLDAVKKSPATDWANIQAPRLGIFNLPTVEARQPWYLYLNAEQKELFDQNWPAIVEWYHTTLTEFAAPQPDTPTPVVHTMSDVSHWI